MLTHYVIDNAGCVTEVASSLQEICSWIPKGSLWIYFRPNVKERTLENLAGETKKN